MDSREVVLCVLGGPIKFWWDDNWETPLHWHYEAWREALSVGLVADGRFLVYRPHHAFKGTWTERGQVVNDAAINAGDIFFDMTPPGVLSEGTDSEKLQFSSSGGTIVPAAPPERKEDFDEAIGQLIEHVVNLGVGHVMIDQRPVLECISWLPNREWMFAGLIEAYRDNVIRLHYAGSDDRFMVDDVRHPQVDRQALTIAFDAPRSGRIVIPIHRLFKAEVLSEAI